MIDRVPVKSSNIKATGYDPETKTMAIEFSSGEIYHYENVEKSVHDDLIGAKSIGKHFYSTIKSGYKFKKQ